MKHNLFRALILTPLFCFAISLCFPRTLASHERTKTRKSSWSLPQQSNENNQKKKGVEENRGSNPGQDGKGRVANSEANTIRIDTNLVVFDALVLAPGGNPVSGLKQEDFEVFEDGRPQEIGTFAEDDGATVPRSIILIIDYSPSQFAYVKDSIEAAKVLVDKLKPKDRMAVVTDDVAVLVPFTQDKALLKEGLDSLKRKVTRHIGGKSMQLSALLAILQDFEGREGRPIIVLQSDGDEVYKLKGIADESVPEEERRNFGLEEIYHTVEQRQATVYTIIPGPRLLGLSIEEQMKNLRAIVRLEYPLRKPSPGDYERILAYRLREHKMLTGISTLSGGWTTYLEKPSYATDIYTQLFTSFGQRYILGYYPANDMHSGKRRAVEIKVRDHPEYQILRRKAYYDLERPNPR
ncbi:MAG: VWA domain-containing protein [Chloracidobacterium sp.]|nr:VWA domain-containing protein [Chloracidobacterium sp.]